VHVLAWAELKLLAASCEKQQQFEFTFGPDGTFKDRDLAD
jgi:hypothetical protein